MKKFAILLAAGLGVVTASMPASAAPAPGYGHVEQAGWQNIDGRQSQLEARINQGIRSGALTRREADQLRAKFRSIVSLEARYRASPPGLTMTERHDLDRRFDALSQSVRIDKHNRDHRG